MASEFTWTKDSPEKLLAERFHITTGFHQGQRDIIERLVQGKRVLAIQRTGWGKSLCYQMASLYYPYLTIVFSPLKALMRDQYLRCNEVYHIPAAIVSSDFSKKDFVNWVQKEQNVKDAFAVPSPELVAGRTLLLIDDIYDSGYTLRAATQALIQAGAVAVYPFTITRTLHSDDQ